MTSCDLEEVERRAITYAQRFAHSGIKKGGKLPRAIQAILQELLRQEKTMTELALVNIGVTPLWVRHHSEIPVIVEAVGKP